MLYPTTYLHTNDWLPTLRTWVAQWLTTLTAIPVQQIQLPAGDRYHLEAGSYRLRLLAGSVWLPEVGIFAAGEQVVLTVGASGQAIHSYANHTAVLAVRADR